MPPDDPITEHRHYLEWTDASNYLAIATKPDGSSGVRASGTFGLYQVKRHRRLLGPGTFLTEAQQGALRTALIMTGADDA